jgi:hypothetical protein
VAPSEGSPDERVALTDGIGGDEDDEDPSAAGDGVADLTFEALARAFESIGAILRAIAPYADPSHLDLDGLAEMSPRAWSRSSW